MSARALGSTVRLVLVRYAEVMEDRTYLHATLREGAEQADEIASATLDAAKKVRTPTTTSRRSNVAHTCCALAGNGDHLSTRLRVARRGHCSRGSRGPPDAARLLSRCTRNPKTELWG